LACRIFISGDDGKGKKSLRQPMNKQVPGRLENEFCSEKQRKEKRFGNFQWSPTPTSCYLFVNL